MIGGCRGGTDSDIPFSLFSYISVGGRTVGPSLGSLILILGPCPWKCRLSWATTSWMRWGMERRDLKIDVSHLSSPLHTIEIRDGCGHTHVQCCSRSLEHVILLQPSAHDCAQQAMRCKRRRTCPEGASTALYGTLRYKPDNPSHPS